MEQNFELPTHTSKPLLKRHFSISTYLQNYYDYRKSENIKFSYEQWAIELGFKSKSSLRMMTIGRRSISTKLIDSFTKKENFNETDKQYFLLLAKLQNIKNTSVKKIFLDRIAELADFDYKTKSVKDASIFLSSPELYIIQMLVSFKDFEFSELNIRKMLKMNAKNLKKYLIQLKDMNLIESVSSEKNKDVIWKSKVNFFTAKNELQKESVNIFHLQTAKELEKIIQQNILDKKIRSLFFSLGEIDYAELVEAVDQFANKLKNKYANDFIKNKKIYKINLQVYPITDLCD